MPDSTLRVFPWWFFWTYAQARLVLQFYRAGATSPAAAQASRLSSSIEEATLERLVSDGIIREATSGRYYLDEPALAAKQRIQVRLLRWLIAGLVTVALLGIVAEFML